VAPLCCKQKSEWATHCKNVIDRRPRTNISYRITRLAVVFTRLRLTITCSMQYLLSQKQRSSLNVIELVTTLDPLSLLCDPPNRAELSVAPCLSVCYVSPISWNRKVDQFTSRNIFARPTDRLCDICLRLFGRAACLSGRLAVHLQYTSLTGDHSHSHSHSANLVNLFTAACVDTQTIQWREVYFWNKKSNCSMHAEYLIVVC